MELALMTKRGPGRPPKPKETLVQAALNRPLPEGLQAAMDRVQKAMEAEDAVRAVERDGREHEGDVDRQIAHLRQQISEATIRREVADRLGDDDGAPTQAAIDALQAELEAKVVRHADRTTRDVAFATEKERRRQDRLAAARELSELLRPGSEALLKAADEQLAECARQAGEAYLAVAKLLPEKPLHEVWLSKVREFGVHDTPEEIEIDQLLERAADLVFRGALGR